MEKNSDFEENHPHRPLTIPPNPEDLYRDLKSHPFFYKPKKEEDDDTPTDDEPLPPLLAGLQDLKFSPEENSPAELSANYREEGHFYYKLGKWRMAERNYSEALKYAFLVDSAPPPGDSTDLPPAAVAAAAVAPPASLHHNIGMCHTHLLNHSLARTHFREALKISPSYTKAWRHLIKNEVESGHFSEAKKAVTEAKKHIEEELFDAGFLAKIEKGVKGEELKRRSDKVKGRSQRAERRRLVEEVRKRGVVLIKGGGVEEEEQEEEEHQQEIKCRIDENGVAHWGVMFFYPEFGQGDFVEEFEEGECFSTHLKTILPPPYGPGPGQSTEDDYKPETVRLYQVRGLDDEESATPTTVEIPKDKTLAEVVKGQRLSKNGVWTFIVLSDVNEFGRVWRGRLLL